MSISPTVSAPRRILVQILAVILIVFFVVEAWGLLDEPVEDSATPGPISSADQSQEFSFYVQTRAFVGALLYIEQNQEELKKQVLPISSIRSQLLDGYHDGAYGPLSQLSPQLNLSTKFRLKRAIAAYYFGFKDAGAKIFEQLDSTALSGQELVLKNSVGSLMQPKFPELKPATADVTQISAAVQELGYFGQMLCHMTAPSALPDCAGDFESVSIFAFKKFIVAIFGIAVFAASSLLLCAMAVYAFTTKRFVFRFQRSSIPTEYLLESFVIYLALMYGGMRGIRYAHDSGLRFNPLLANLILILSIPLVILWPASLVKSFQAVRNSVGLWFGGIVEALRNFVLGPMAYAAAWTPLLFILIIYSVFVYLLGLDMTKGSHPIVPILLTSQNNSAVLYVVLLATVAAPFTEEILFRGVFYTWLRERMSPILSMFTSALVFAAIHPQGALGVVPLASIGFVLAFLREWRGSLLTPMIAHACFNGGTLLLIFLFLK